MQARIKTVAGNRLGAGTALAAAFAIGCMAAPGFALAGTADGIRTSDQAASAKKFDIKKLDRAILSAERAVAKEPQNAEVRVRLAQTYLGAGRFTSAATSFEDAVSLGDKAPSTALGMALSYIGSGRNAEATALLGQWHDTLPVSDHALALALAGQPGEAVSILGAAIKQGENTSKIRQNLAYALVLSGHLPEARTVAAQDVPADQLEARVSDWALQASVGTTQSRVAALLGAPLRSDPGQPAQLALASASGAPALAVAEAPVPSAPVAEELPALAAPAPMTMLAQVEPQFASAAVAPEPAPATALADAGGATRQFVSNPLVQDTSAYAATRVASAEPAAPARLARAVVTPRTAAPRTVAHARAAKAVIPVAGTHVVQLGSFASEDGARRAWNIFVHRDPSLKDRELLITKAQVNGRSYWRVAAAGFDAGSARAKCSSVGGNRDCLAYTARRQLPGALSTIAQRLASR